MFPVIETQNNSLKSCEKNALFENFPRLKKTVIF